MKIKNFIFIIPNTSWFDNRYWHNFPYTVGLLSAVLIKHGYEVQIIDANLENLSEESLRERITAIRPSIVAISAMTIMYAECIRRSFKIVKDVGQDIITLIGGIYPTLSLDIAAKDKNIDYIISGEGEGRIIALLQAIESGSGFDKIDGLTYKVNRGLNYVTNPAHKFLADLDTLPLPDYKIFDMQKYMNYGQKFTQNFQFRAFPYAETMTSRGCPYRCIFCSSSHLYGDRPIRYRSTKHILSEIDMLVKDYRIKEVIFLDDSFLQSKQRAIEIMQALIDRDYGLLWKSNNLSIFLMDDKVLEMMKKSGCYQLSVSIESGHPRTLKRIRKPVDLKKIQHTISRIKELDIELISNFVIGFPGETMDEIRETFRYSEEIDIDYVLFSIATPLPGTELYEMCKTYKCLPKDFNFETFDFYGFGRGVITTDEFTPFELQVLRAFEWDRINFKTEEKKKKIAKMIGVTVEELDQWRKETRQKLGVDVEAASKA
jgi:anaerobic magnesium-protoporphyrin IX monomethyl ester cyclase